MGLFKKYNESTFTSFTNIKQYSEFTLNSTNKSQYAKLFLNTINQCRKKMAESIYLPLGILKFDTYM